QVEPDPGVADEVPLVAVVAVLEDAILGAEVPAERRPPVGRLHRAAPGAGSPAGAEERPDRVAVRARAELLVQEARAREARGRARARGRRRGCCLLVRLDEADRERDADRRDDDGADEQLPRTRARQTDEREAEHGADLGAA